MPPQHRLALNSGMTNQLGHMLQAVAGPEHRYNTATFALCLTLISTPRLHCLRICITYQVCMCSLPIE